MNVIHIQITETKVIDFDVRKDSFRCWSPFCLEIKQHGRKDSHKITASIKEIKELARRLEAAMEDVTIDCTDLKVVA